MRTIFDIIIFVAGFGACWLCKDAVVRLAMGTESLINSLEAKLAVLRGES
ncbi:hypothetical protein JQ543_02620 [Bradyrhizobium diazoefficiens]|nr:hypothetical protein [Bradyrhizobium diazoefficiens]MBR0846623.1 hypothetical protein [Bradyrhizobium diazoefficiens]